MLSPAEWDALPWDVTRAYLWGLEQDGTIGEAQDGELPDGFEPTVRSDVDAGTDVIDLAAMRTELEAGRAKRTGGS
jgi:hypothetical protein